mmetsp:Transcript_108172/g.316306  ORF Transcript_108172/g.316306 Transcript_108172/m.316306 type:complete len:269 (+) Transcript_108172:530-1336(+)
MSAPSHAASASWAPAAGASAATQRPDLTCRMPQFDNRSKAWSSTASPFATQRRSRNRAPAPASGQGDTACQLGPACFTEMSSNSTANQSLAPMAAKPVSKSRTCTPWKRLQRAPLGASSQPQARSPMVVRERRQKAPGGSDATLPPAKPCLGGLPSFGPPAARDQAPPAETQSTRPLCHIWSTRAAMHAAALACRLAGSLKDASTVMSCHSRMPSIETGPLLPPSLQPIGSSGTIWRMTLLPLLPLTSGCTSKTPIWSAHHLPSCDSS